MINQLMEMLNKMSAKITNDKHGGITRITFCSNPNETLCSLHIINSYLNDPINNISSDMYSFNHCGTHKRELEHEIGYIHNITGGNIDENLQILFTKCDEFHAIAFIRSFIFLFHDYYDLDESKSIVYKKPYKDFRNDDDIKRYFMQLVSKIPNTVTNHIISNLTTIGVVNVTDYNNFWDNAYITPNLNSKFRILDDVMFTNDIIEEEVMMRTCDDEIYDSLVSERLLHSNSICMHNKRIENNARIESTVSMIESAVSIFGL